MDLPSPPFISIPGVANFRDIGGYSCHVSDFSSSNNGHLAPTQSIRVGLVFRSGDFSGIQADGLSQVQSLSIRKVFDLRSESELKSKQGNGEGGEKGSSSFGKWSPPSTDSDRRTNINVQDFGIERVWVPVFAASDYGPEQVALRAALYAQSGSAGFVNAYQGILDHGVGAYRTILTHLAQEEPEACLIHCSAGKDRTGVLIALLLMLCGVQKEVIADEYALTELGLGHLKPAIIEKLLQNPKFSGNEHAARDMISSKKENMLATMQMIEDIYGGAERYVLERLELDESTLRQLRKNLTCREKAVL